MTNTEVDEKFRSEADELLYQIAEQEHLLRLKATRAQVKIDEIKKDFQGEKAEIDREIKALKKELEGVSKAEFRRSKLPGYRLTFGEITFRKSSELKPLRGFKWDTIVELLQKKGKDQFIRMVPEVNKDAVKGANLESEKLAELGMKIAEKHPFKFTLDQEAFEQRRTNQPSS